MRGHVGFWMTIVAAGTLAACGDATPSRTPENRGDAEPEWMDNNNSLDGDYYDEGSLYYPGTEEYAEWVENDFVDATTENTSTFSIDVDTGSYTIMRRDVMLGKLPAPASVRPEEYINYFDYDYVEPTGDAPFSINLEAAPSRFGAMDAEAETDTPTRHLLRVGLRGKDVDTENMKPTNLVFLVDVSGSMAGEKLELVEHALHTLVNHLRPTDTVGIITYAGAERTLLESGPIDDGATVRAAIDELDELSGGSTYGEAGIVAAYEMLERVSTEDGNNRVVILSDGDFNVGKSGDELVDFVAGYREKHLSLTVAGVGMGNYKDGLMEGLARKANGNYVYLDSRDEAERAFGTNLVSMLEVIASDVKIQVEFNENVVSRYRLVGYENRVLENEDFEDDTKDAGEIGPGHRVTAYYELELHEEAPQNEMLAEVRLRYKPQYGDDSLELSHNVKASGVHGTFDDASVDFQFGAAVAEFAEILRESKFSSGDGFDDIITIASQKGDDVTSEFISLVEKARDISQ